MKMYFYVRKTSSKKSGSALSSHCDNTSPKNKKKNKKKKSSDMDLPCPSTLTKCGWNNASGALNLSPPTLMTRPSGSCKINNKIKIMEREKICLENGANSCPKDFDKVPTFKSKINVLFALQAVKKLF